MILISQINSILFILWIHCFYQSFKNIYKYLLKTFDSLHDFNFGIVLHHYIISSVTIQGVNRVIFTSHSKSLLTLYLLELINM